MGWNDDPIITPEGEEIPFGSQDEIVSKKPVGGAATNFLKNMVGQTVRNTASMVPELATGAYKGLLSVAQAPVNILDRAYQERQALREDEKAGNTRWTQPLYETGIGGLAASLGGTDTIQGMKAAQNKTNAELARFEKEDLPEISSLSNAPYAKAFAQGVGMLPAGAILSNPAAATAVGYGEGGAEGALKSMLVAKGAEKAMKFVQGDTQMWNKLNEIAIKHGWRGVNAGNIERIVTSPWFAKPAGAAVNVAATKAMNPDATGPDMVSSMLLGGTLTKARVPEYRTRYQSNITDAYNNALGVSDKVKTPQAYTAYPDTVSGLTKYYINEIQSGKIGLTERDGSTSNRLPKTAQEGLEIIGKVNTDLKTQRDTIARETAGDAPQPQLVGLVLEPFMGHLNDVAVRAKVDPVMRKAVGGAKQAQAMMQEVLQGGADVDRLNTAADVLEKYADTLDLSRPGDVYDAMGKLIQRDERKAFTAANKEAFDPITGELVANRQPTMDQGLPKVVGNLQQSANLANQAAGARDIGTSRLVDKLQKPAQPKIVEQLIDIGQDKAKFLEGDPIRKSARDLRRVAEARGEVVMGSEIAAQLRAAAGDAATNITESVKSQLLNRADMYENLGFVTMDEALSTVSGHNANNASFNKAGTFGSDSVATALQAVRGIETKALNRGVIELLKRVSDNPRTPEKYREVNSRLVDSIELGSALTESVKESRGSTGMMGNIFRGFRNNESHLIASMLDAARRSKDGSIKKAFENGRRLLLLDSGQSNNSAEQNYKPDTSRSLAPGFSPTDTEEQFY